MSPACFVCPASCSLCISKLTHLSALDSRSRHHHHFLFLIAPRIPATLSRIFHLTLDIPPPNGFVDKYLRPGLINPFLVPHIAAHPTRHSNSSDQEASPSSCFSQQTTNKPPLLLNDPRQPLFTDPNENGCPQPCRVRSLPSGQAA